MADEKLNTGPEVQKTEEAPAPAVTDPAHGEAGRCGNLCGAD